MAAWIRIGGQALDQWTITLDLSHSIQDQWTRVLNYNLLLISRQALDQWTITSDLSHWITGQRTTVVDYTWTRINGQAQRMTAPRFSRWVNAAMIKDCTRTALTSQGSYSHWVSGPLTLVSSCLTLHCILKGQSLRTVQLLFSHWIDASQRRVVDDL